MKAENSSLLLYFIEAELRLDLSSLEVQTLLAEM